MTWFVNLVPMKQFLYLALALQYSHQKMNTKQLHYWTSFLQCCFRLYEKNHISDFFFGFATTFFSLSSASLLHFSFSQPLLYFFIFIFELAKVLRLETFRLVNIGKSVVGHLP